MHIVAACLTSGSAVLLMFGQGGGPRKASGVGRRHLLEVWVLVGAK